MTISVVVCMTLVYALLNNITDRLIRFVPCCIQIFVNRTATASPSFLIRTYSFKIQIY